jgi:hypothetical protein
MHVPNALVASSRPKMTELRRLKKVLDKLGLQLLLEWIPFVANKLEDALSRLFSPGDLAVRQTLRRSVVDEMMAPLNSLPLRPLGEPPVFIRRECHNELASHWSRDERRLLCSPERTHSSSNEDATNIQSICPPCYARLAEKIMVQAGHGHEHQGASPAASPGRSLDRDTTTESILESPANRSQPASLRPFRPTQL